MLLKPFANGNILDLLLSTLAALENCVHEIVYYRTPDDYLALIVWWTRESQYFQ